MYVHAYITLELGRVKTDHCGVTGSVFWPCLVPRVCCVFNM